MKSFISGDMGMHGTAYTDFAIDSVIVIAIGARFDDQAMEN